MPSLPYQPKRSTTIRPPVRWIVLLVTACVLAIVAYRTVRATRFAKVDEDAVDRLLFWISGQNAAASSLSLRHSAQTSGFGPRVQWFEFKCAPADMPRFKAAIIGNAPRQNLTIQFSPPGDADDVPDWWTPRFNALGQDILGVHQPGGTSVWILTCPENGSVFILCDRH